MKAPLPGGLSFHLQIWSKIHVTWKTRYYAHHKPWARIHESSRAPSPDHGLQRCIAEERDVGLNGRVYVMLLGSWLGTRLWVTPQTRKVPVMRAIFGNCCYNSGSTGKFPQWVMPTWISPFTIRFDSCEHRAFIGEAGSHSLVGLRVCTWPTLLIQLTYTSKQKRTYLSQFRSFI